MEIRVGNSGIGVKVSPCSSIEDISGLSRRYLILIIGQIGSELYNHILFVDPEVMNPGVIRNAIFCNNLRLDLVGPINFEYGMVVGQN
jgi:hypothetical protein